MLSPLRLSTTSWSFVCFTIFCLLIIYRLQYVSSRDPTSVFFDPRQAYVPSYSILRQQEAEAFVSAADKQHPGPQVKHTTETRNKSLCVGVPSISRDGASYLQSTVGSLLEGLTVEEREDVHLVVFIPHTDPSVHPAYGKHWLSNLTDELLLYDLPIDELDRIRHLESDAGLFREKGLFDYTYLLKACYDKQTPYIAIFEDDIVAMDGWYHRTIAGLRQAETLSVLEKGQRNFLYLRLFYTEEFLGWNSEDWKTYLSFSLFLASLVTANLVGVRSVSVSVKRALPDRILLAICGICLPALILLFFAAGKVTTLPLPNGVNSMEKYGCCSQGLVFPRESARALGEWFEAKKIGFVDMLAEEYADEHDELRWALTPSVIQHIGRKSSKEDDTQVLDTFHMTVAEKLWNFAFETNNAVDLRREHNQAVQSRNRT